MVTVKRWLFKHTIDEFGPDDFIWLQGLKCRVECIRNDIPYAIGDRTYTVAGRSEVVVTSFNDKQSTMIELKYGTSMVLASIMHAESGGIIQDRWGTISIGYDNQLL